MWVWDPETWYPIWTHQTRYNHNQDHDYDLLHPSLLLLPYAQSEPSGSKHYQSEACKWQKDSHWWASTSRASPSPTSCSSSTWRPSISNHNQASAPPLERPTPLAEPTFSHTSPGSSLFFWSRAAAAKRDVGLCLSSPSLRAWESLACASLWRFPCFAGTRGWSGLCPLLPARCCRKRGRTRILEIAQGPFLIAKWTSPWFSLAFPIWLCSFFMMV